MVRVGLNLQPYATFLFCCTKRCFANTAETERFPYPVSVFLILKIFFVSINYLLFTGKKINKNCHKSKCVFIKTERIK